jgi:predicted phospho-2-dehydro-3-deoxyheptonate aldolase
VTGKKLRLYRFLNPDTGRTVTVPMDHGLYRGPALLPSLADPKKICQKLIDGGADAIIVHRGIARTVADVIAGRIGLIVKLTNTTLHAPEKTYQALLSSVEDAVRLGADAVSVQVDCRAEKEADMLRHLGETADICDAWGVPLLAMMYFVPDEKTDSFDADALSHVARIGGELGADIVKTRYTGDSDTFSKVVSGANAPIVIAGGPKADSTRKVLEHVKEAIDAGAIGVSMGRNIFQHEDPAKMVRALRKIIHEDMEVEDAEKELR